jgi:hypothetical protein
MIPAGAEILRPHRPMEPLIVAQSKAGKCSDRLDSPLPQPFCVKIEFSFPNFRPEVAQTAVFPLPTTH